MGDILLARLEAASRRGGTAEPRRSESGGAAAAACPRGGPAVKAAAQGAESRSEKPMTPALATS